MEYNRRKNAQTEEPRKWCFVDKKEGRLLYINTIRLQIQIMGMRA